MLINQQFEHGAQPFIQNMVLLDTAFDAITDQVNKQAFRALEALPVCFWARVVVKKGQSTASGAP